MALIGIKAEQVDSELMLYALSHQPSLVLDCANCADPHRFYPHVSPEQFKGTYIVSVDALYRFRDTVKRAASFADALGAKTIVVTTFDRLFTYHDEAENVDVLGHVWEMLATLGRKYTVVVPYDVRCGVVIMGHTVSSGRVATDELISELRTFGSALSPKERELYERMLSEPLKHISKISYTSSMHLWAFFLLSIMLEQEKRMRKLSEERENPPEMSAEGI
jgi:hypothetical protein